MLVITRRVGEKIIITTPGGDRLTVMVVDTKPGGIRLGFDTPPDYTIYRSELDKATVQPCGRCGRHEEHSWKQCQGREQGTDVTAST